jgi:hypothetical protein
VSPAILALLLELGIELEAPVQELLEGIFKRNPAEQELAQLKLERLAGDKRAEAKFGPLPPSSLP